MTEKKTSKDFNPRIFSQSFSEAGGREVFPDLEPVGRLEITVSTLGTEGSDYGYAIAKENKFQNPDIYKVSVCEGLKKLPETELEDLFKEIVLEETQAEDGILGSRLLIRATQVFLSARSYTLFKFQDNRDNFVGDAYRPAS
jgi:hypothetical protein